MAILFLYGRVKRLLFSLEKSTTTTASDVDVDKMN